MNETPETLARLQSLIDNSEQTAVPSVRRDNSKLPRNIDALIARLLAKDPNDRPESAAAVLTDLDRIAASL